MPERFEDRIGLYSLTALAAGLVIARACLQSITIDEANTGLDFVSGPTGIHWYPSSGNHVLYSALARLTTTIFGLSELSMRMPAILGALMYVGAALYSCVLVSSRTILRIPLFLCLVYNPMVLDYLVAARGYSLAIGFLFAALALITAAVISGAEPTRCLSRACLASVFLGLSFSANFSFAYVDAITILFFFVWAFRSAARWKFGYVRLALYCFLPGLVVAFVICGPTVWQFPRSQLYFGSQSLTEMWHSMMSPTFDDLNPNVFNPWMLILFGKLRSKLPWLNVIFGLLLVLSVEAARLRARKPNHALTTMVRMFAGIGLVTFALHWLAFFFAHIPLPSGRTGLFFVLLWPLAFGTALAMRFERPRAGVLGLCALAVLIATAAYFTGCLRLLHFKEWQFDTDTKQIYWTVADLRQRCGIANFDIDWRYSSAVDFYRLAYHNTALPNFPADETGKPPLDRDGYVIYFPNSEDFVKQQHLQVVYHNQETDSAVAIRRCPGAN
ncbi:MAG TPA: hypothetical protein VKX49_14075 [Bryobacteraceae bacterium]|nr:hypothetical protein [Bryobacteraceae bacterium]